MSNFDQQYYSYQIMWIFIAEDLCTNYILHQIKLIRKIYTRLDIKFHNNV